MNKKSYLSRVRLPRTPAEWLEAVMNFIFFLCGMLAVGCVVLISVYMVISGVPAIHKIGLFQFLFGTKWASTAAQPLFGILPFILSSIYGTLGAAIIGVPIGLLTAVFLSKAADPKLRTVVVTAIAGAGACRGKDLRQGFRCLPAERYRGAFHHDFAQHRVRVGHGAECRAAGV